MGSISVWHWIVLLVIFGIPLAIIAFAPAGYRVRRKRYGLALLATLIGFVLLQVVAETARRTQDTAQNGDVPTLLVIAGFAVLGWSLYLVRLAVGRAQDAGLSKWIVLLSYVPLLNLVILVVLLLKRSKTLDAPPAAASTGPAGA